MPNQRPSPSAVQLTLLKPQDGDPDNNQIEQTPRRESESANKINRFILNLVTFNISRMALKMYLAGTIRTIERRFGFRSATTSYVFSLTDFAHIALVLFLGHFGRTGHKPRMIGITSIFPAIAGLLMAAPYFILPSSSPQQSWERNSSFSTGQGVAQMCNGIPEDEICDGGMDQSTQNNIAVGFFLVGSLLMGVGGPATFTLGIPYIDENAGRAKTSISVGLIAASFALGPVLGLLLASVCTRLPENLKGTNMKPTDPQFIGAWWLGFGFGSIVTLLLGAPLLFYPKHMTVRAATAARAKSNRTEKPCTQTIRNKLKAIFRNVGQLLRIKAYVALVIADLFGTFVALGFFLNLPRYMEVYFLMPAYQANVVVASSAAIMSILGGLLGGAILSRLRTNLIGIAKLLLLCGALVLVLSCPLLFIRCPTLEVDREFDLETKSFSLTTTCNRNCSCLANKQTYMPVCGSDDVTYFSPCHAGCTLSSANGSFHECGCTEGGAARAGLCLDTCPLYLPFAVGAGLISLAGGIVRPAYIMGFMRTVPDKERSFALAVSSFALNLFALLPSPIFYGHMIDSACDLWQNICGESGNCLFYDSEKFRWRTFGAGMIFVVAKVLMLILFFCIVRRKKPESATIRDDIKQEETLELSNELGGE